MRRVLVIFAGAIVGLSGCAAGPRSADQRASNQQIVVVSLRNWEYFGGEHDPEKAHWLFRGEDVGEGMKGFNNLMRRIKLCPKGGYLVFCDYMGRQRNLIYEGLPPIAPWQASDPDWDFWARMWEAAKSRDMVFYCSPSKDGTKHWQEISIGYRWKRFTRDMPTFDEPVDLREAMKGQ